MPPPHAQVCFYFNVMPEGCRKAADECEFAHVYLDGALQARRRAEAQGILPPITSSGGDGEEARQPPQLDQRAPQGWSGGVDPRMQQQQQQLSALSAGGGAVEAAGATYAPSSWQHQQHAYAPPAPLLDPGLVAAAARDGVVYETRPTKVYVQMPRSARTGQRVCYYHNAGKCTARACPFLHVLVRTHTCTGWVGLLFVSRNPRGEILVRFDPSMMITPPSESPSFSQPHRSTCARSGPQPSSSRAAPRGAAPVPV